MNIRFYCTARSKKECAFWKIVPRKDRCGGCTIYMSGEFGEGVCNIDPATDTLVEPEKAELQTKPADPTPLEIAKMIRDNNYGCHKIVLCKKCPIEKIPCGNSSTTKEKFDIRKKAIDTYISEHEKVGPVMPEPIKFSDNVPAFVYMVTEKAIKKEKAIAFLQRKTESGIVERIVFDYGGEHTFENCYKTLADAVRVAESKWSVK